MVDALGSVELEKQACMPNVAAVTKVAKIIRLNIVELPLLL
jgi:hypothetical protein